jgi:hypothetical protein
MGTDDPQNPRFHRILFVVEGEPPQDVLQVLKEYADDVTFVDLQNCCALDYLQLFADCMVVDSRIEDFTGVGTVVTTATSRLLRTLVLHDDRPGWEAGSISGPQWEPFDPVTVLDTLRDFLDETQPIDYQDLDLRQPWLTRPWTLTMAHIHQARVLGSHPPY